MEQNNNVIGPIQSNDWLALRMLRRTIPFMKKDPKRFSEGLEMEEAWQKEIYQKYKLQ